MSAAKNAAHLTEIQEAWLEVAARLDACGSHDSAKLARELAAEPPPRRRRIRAFFARCASSAGCGPDGAE